MTPRVAIPAGNACGEGLTRIGPDLYWTDINRFLVHRHRPGSTALETWRFDEPVVALAETADPNELLVALASKLIFWRPAADARRDQGFRLDGYPALRLNDGRAAPDGRFWVGSMANNVAEDGTPGEVAAGQGALYAVGAGGAEVLLEDIGVPNTLCWAPDLATFYFADTLENKLCAYSYDAAAGTIGAPRTHLSGHPRGLPDGSAMDAEGFLWNCRFGGGCVLRIAPDGTVDRIVELPVGNVTTCTFAGPDLRSLYITTAMAWPARFERQAGDLFVIDTDVPGRPDFIARL